MSGNLRANPILWSAATLTNGQAATSAAAFLGPMVNAAVLVKSDSAITFTIQAAVDSSTGPGRNLLDSNTVWYDYVRADSYETASGVEGNLAKIVFGGAGAVAVDVSPFAPTYLRLSTADGKGAVITASVVISGA